MARVNDCHSHGCNLRLTRYGSGGNHQSHTIRSVAYFFVACDHKLLSLRSPTLSSQGTELHTWAKPALGGPVLEENAVCRVMRMVASGPIQPGI
jgi:hypothetical protein